MRREALSLADALRLIAQFRTFPISIHEPATPYERALVLADANSLPAAYDAHYVALAQILGCNLWTNDRRLLNLLGGRLAFVRPIGDYQDGDPV